jgi:hypothetical protein
VAKKIFRKYWKNIGAPGCSLKKIFKNILKNICEYSEIYMKYFEKYLEIFWKMFGNVQKLFFAPSFCSLFYWEIIPSRNTLPALVCGNIFFYEKNISQKLHRLLYLNYQCRPPAPSAPAGSSSRSPTWSVTTRDFCTVFPTCRLKS